MDRVRQLAGKMDVHDSSPESKEREQEQALLNEQGDGDRHSEQDSEKGSETQFIDTRRPQRPWIRWILATLLFVVYTALLSDFLTREPSELQCAKKLTVYCEYTGDKTHLC